MEKNGFSQNQKLEEQLTDRELEVLKHLVTGKNNIQIGKVMGLSPHTIKVHVGSIMRKMAVEARVQAAVKAVKCGIVD